MKPTSRNSIERRLEALETQKAAKERTPELRLILNKGDGSKEIHILGQKGVVIVPAKMTVEEWTAKAAQWQAT